MATFDNNYFKKRLGKVFSELQALENELMDEMRIELSDTPHPDLAQNHINGIFNELKKLSNTVQAA